MKHVSLSIGLWLGSLSLFCAAVSCSDNAAERIPRMGRVEVALTSTSSSGIQYRLRNGTFRITGIATKTLSSDAQPDAPTLTAELPAGGYSVELAPGWSLQKRTASGGYESVKAALGSANPVAFTIVEQQSTSVLFRFRVGNDVIQFGNGRLTVQIEVDDCQPDAGGACGSGGAASDAAPDGVGASGSGGTGGANEDAGFGDAGASGEDGGVSCFADGQCAGGQCTGGQVSQVCLLPGDQCTSHADCRRFEYCDGAGHCVPAAGLDQPCSPGSRCGRDPSFGQLWCDSNSQCIAVEPGMCQYDEQCEDGEICKLTPVGYECGSPISGEGQRCTSSSPCDETSWCVTPHGEPFSICARRRLLGEACEKYADPAVWPPCAAGLFCDAPPDDPFSGHCAESPSEGSPCINPCYLAEGCPSSCAANHYCDADSICRSFATAGQSCATRQCAADLFCDPGKVCRSFAEHGDLCETTPCAAGLRCEAAHVGGTCTP